MYVAPARAGVSLDQNVAVAGGPTGEQLYVVPKAPGKDSPSHVLYFGDAAATGDCGTSDGGVREYNDAEWKLAAECEKHPVYSHDFTEAA